MTIRLHTWIRMQLTLFCRDHTFIRNLVFHNHIIIMIYVYMNHIFIDFLVSGALSVIN